jgi:hypothetical protein
MPNWRDSLPPEVSADIHGIMAKAMFMRLQRVGCIPPGGTVTLTQGEIDQASAAEFEYDLYEGGGLIFREAR